MFFITSLPWVSFTAITHPFCHQYASIPLISVRGYFRQGDALLLPVVRQAHHALADGLHVGGLFKAFFDRCSASAARLDLHPATEQP